MEQIMNILTHDKLLGLLRYNPSSGVFTWINRKNSRRPESNIAGAKSNGYIQIQINKVIYKAHRLAWLYMTGAMPLLEIDHINGDHGDNVFSNLREVDSSTNKENARVARSDNASGMIGAHYHKKFGWRSSIRVKGKCIHLGYFSTAKDASDAYVKAKREMHYGCTI